MKKEELLSLLKLPDPFENFTPSEDSELKSWDSDPHMLRYLLEQMPTPRSIIEVGSWKGYSATAMATWYTQHQQYTDFTLICVDTWLGSLEHWSDSQYHADLKFNHGRPDFYHDFLNTIYKAKLDPWVLPLAMPSGQAARYLKQAGVTTDLVFLDGSHDVNDVYTDVVLYWELIEPGGFIFGDAFSWRSVQKALDLFITQNNLECCSLRNNWWIYKN